MPDLVESCLVEIEVRDAVRGLPDPEKLATKLRRYAQIDAAGVVVMVPELGGPLTPLEAAERLVRRGC